MQLTANTRIPLSMCPFPFINFASFVNPAMMDWAARVAADYISIVSSAEFDHWRYQYTLITEVAAVLPPPRVRVPSRCVYGLAFRCPTRCCARPRRYYYRIPPGCGIASRSNWTLPRIAPSPRGVSTIPSAHGFRYSLSRVYSAPGVRTHFGISVLPGNYRSWRPAHRASFVIGSRAFTSANLLTRRRFRWLLINFLVHLNQLGGHRARCVAELHTRTNVCINRSAVATLFTLTWAKSVLQKYYMVEVTA